MKKDKIVDAFKNDKGVRVKSDRPSQGYKLQGYDYVRFTNLDKRDEYVLAKKPKLQRDGTFSKTEYSKPIKVKSDIKIKKSGTK
jgi:hypothetical protein